MNSHALYCMCEGGACVPWHTCGGQRTTFRSWFFPSPMWVPETELWLGGECLYCWPNYSKIDSDLGRNYHGVCAIIMESVCLLCQVYVLGFLFHFSWSLNDFLVSTQDISRYLPLRRSCTFSLYHLEHTSFFKNQLAWSSSLNTQALPCCPGIPRLIDGHGFLFSWACRCCPWGKEYGPICNWGSWNLPKKLSMDSIGN